MRARFGLSRCGQTFFGRLHLPDSYIKKAPGIGGLPRLLCCRKGRGMLPAHAQSKSILDSLLYKQLTSSLSFFASGQAMGCKRWGLPQAAARGKPPIKTAP